MMDDQTITMDKAGTAQSPEAAHANLINSPSPTSRSQQLRHGSTSAKSKGPSLFCLGLKQD